MSFVGRARSSFERGDTLRAVLTLVAGLRRTPNRADALELLVELVRDEVESGGIEHEIVQVLVPHPRRDEMLAAMVVGLRERAQNRIAERLILEADRRGMKFVPPPEPEPEPEPDPDSDREPEPEPEGAAEPEPESAAETASEPVVEEQAGGVETDEEPATTAAGRSRETTSAERDRRQEETAAAEARLSERKREAIEQRQAELAAKRRRRSVQIVVLALVVGMAFVGVYVFGVASRSSDLTALETAIGKFNRFDDGALAAVSEAAATRGEAEFSERLAFARALSGETVEVRLDGWETSWGLSAAVVAALKKDDVENALALVTKVERTAPGTLGAEYSRALLEEHRGNTAEARAAAARVIDRYPEFTPAHEVVVRASARQLELDVMDAAIEQLRAIAPDHPYAQMPPLPHPRDVLLGPLTPTAEPPPLATEDPFLRALQSYRRAVSAAAAGDVPAATAHGKKALDSDPNLLPARLLRATALVSAGALDEAIGEFERAAKDARSTQVRLLIQASAPRALAGVGRPDLGARFTSPYPKLRAEGVDDRMDEELTAERPESLRKSALTDVASVPWAAEALYARAYLRAEQGDRAAALAMYRDLSTRSIAPGRAATMRAALGEPSNKEADAVTAMVHDFAAGRFSAVAAAEPVDLPPWALPIVTSLRARSLLALDDVGAANVLIAAAPVGLSYQPQIDALRLLIAAHLGRKNTVFEALSTRLATDESRGVSHAVQVAEALFWQRQFTEAEGWVEKAEKLHPEDRQAAWVCGLVNLGRNRTEDADACFGRTGRAIAETPDVQTALGFVQLEMRRPKQAAERFQAALAIDPSSAAAARGLGEALVDEKGRGAKSAIDRARSGLEGPARGELDRWYAVASGSRKGEESSLESLDAATKLIGERADLIAERARYHAAREEWGPAEQLYESALRRDDTLAEAHIAIARIKIRGDGGEAREHLMRYLEIEPQGTSAAWARQQLE